MSKSAKNLIVVLGIITTVFGAYYFFTQDAALPGLNSTGAGGVQLADLQEKAAEVTKRTTALTAVTINTSLFSDEGFNSLRTFAPEPQEFTVGRADPFMPSPELAPNNPNTTAQTTTP
jgi:hypothetical protein